MSQFEFNLNQQVQITVSGETGQVIARAEYLTGTNSYLLRYRSSDGRAVEAWWNEEALSNGNVGDRVNRIDLPADSTFRAFK